MSESLHASFRLQPGVQQFGFTQDLGAATVRDLDVLAKRPPPRAHALPDDIRAKFKVKSVKADMATNEDETQADHAMEEWQRAKKLAEARAKKEEEKRKLKEEQKRARKEEEERAQTEGASGGSQEKERGGDEKG
eukprot:2302242-Rhodomonas_salina.2